MNKNTLVPGAVILVLAALVVVGFSSHGQKAPAAPAPVLGAATGPELESPYRCLGDFCEGWVGGSFKTATTTLFNIASPINGKGGFSLVDALILNNTGVATSSYRVGCGTTTNVTTDVLASTSTIASGLVATSSSFGVMWNGVSTGSATSSAANGINRVVVKSTEAFICKVTTDGVNAGYDRAFLDVTSTFAGTYKLHWIYERN